MLSNPANRANEIDKQILEGKAILKLAAANEANLADEIDNKPQNPILDSDDGSHQIDHGTKELAHQLSNHYQQIGDRNHSQRKSDSEIRGRQ